MKCTDLSKAALLEQVAEECTELGHAALKLARKYRNENPTPVTEEEAYGQHGRHGDAAYHLLDG